MLELPNEMFEPSNVSKKNREPPNVTIERSYVMILPNVTLKPFNLSIKKINKEKPPNLTIEWSYVMLVQ